MAGIYLHIPFCKQACHYCNFHFSTSTNHREVMVDALLKEMSERRDYLGGQPIESVYFGGGTPSVLPVSAIERLISGIEDIFKIEPGAEITLEANPDDMTDNWLSDLRQNTPVNRLSVGIQSFYDVDLQWMNRAHHAAHARACLESALRQGFDDMSIDLIYGGPTTPDEHWEHNLQIAFDYRIPHLSCYALTVEEGTALHHFVRKGKAEPVEEERSARQFEYLMAAAAQQGYEHYEISNFALPGRHARHNTSYWMGAHYLGLGPAAHSFNGISRRWNIANNARYLAGIEQGEAHFEMETLSIADCFNEYVMTMLRTQWGCNAQRLHELNAEGAVTFGAKASLYMASGDMVLQGDNFILTSKGRLLADRIASEMFIV